MDSTLAAAATTSTSTLAMSLLAFTKVSSSNPTSFAFHLRHNFSAARLIRPCVRNQHLDVLRIGLLPGYDLRRLCRSGSYSVLFHSAPRTLFVADSASLSRRLRCVPGYASSVASGGGGFGGNVGGDGGNDGDGCGATGGGKPRENAVPCGTEDSSGAPSDVIILDVGGMTCGGCAASVKRILESQPQVSSASVNLTTETAIVWPVSEAKVVPNWQKNLGEALAKHLTTCGFTSTLRGQEAIEGDISG